MTDIRFHCPKCGRHLVVDAAGAKLRVRCPHCARHIIVPAESTELPPGFTREPLHVAPSGPHPEPTTHAVLGAPGSSRVWVKCPGCGFRHMHIKCYNCGSEDKFWVQHDGALCYCGSRTARVRCPQCQTAIRRHFFRAFVEPIHAHEGLSDTTAVVGEAP